MRAAGCNQRFRFRLRSTDQDFAWDQARSYTVPTEGTARPHNTPTAAPPKGHESRRGSVESAVFDTHTPPPVPYQVVVLT